MPFWIQADANVEIGIFSVAGEKVRVLDQFQARAGVNEEFWDERNAGGSEAASGIYIARIRALSTGGESQSVFEKFSLLR